MIVLDLREEGRAGSAAISDLPELTDDERRAAIGTWKGRMINEHISARVFAALIPQMMRAGIAPKWQARAAAAIVEEMSHGRQCAAVVTALGGDAFATFEQLPEVPDHEDAEPLEAVLRNILSISCLSETVAVALIGAERLQAGPETLQRTLAGILADEVRHARMGWALLEELAPTFAPELVAGLNRYLVVAFRHLVAHELAHLPSGPAPTQAASDVGVCDGNHARALFFDTVEEIIIPRLETLGFGALEAWKRAGGRPKTEPGTCAPVPTRRI